MLVRGKASHSPRPSVRCEETVQTTENWHRSMGLMTLVARHSSIAFRPAAVIRRRTTSTALRPTFMVSRSAVASPARTRPVTISQSNPWTRTSSASVAPCGLLASRLSSSSVRRGCGLRRRFRMVVIHPVSDAGYLLSINWRAVGLLGYDASEAPVTLTGPRTPKRGSSAHHNPGSIAFSTARPRAVRESRPWASRTTRPITIMPVTTSPIAPAGRRSVPLATQSSRMRSRAVRSVAGGSWGGRSGTWLRMRFVDTDTAVCPIARLRPNRDVNILTERIQ